VHTYQASVIWAFQGAAQGAEPVTRSVDYLASHLQMDEDLLRSALAFWVGKMVLHELRPGEFAVLETLNPADRERSDAVAAAAAAGEGGSMDEDSGLRAAQITEDKMAIYWKFIQGMLKNSAAQMPVQQIGMMLKMLIVEGFPYSNEELAEYLATKVAEGELEMAAGKYKLVKK
jgi:anaphase-promoting complex subunit 2